MSDSETIVKCSDGKAPKKDEKSSRLPKRVPPKRPTNLKCEICNINSSSQCDYDTHLSGKKHLKKLADQSSDGTTLTNDLLGNPKVKKMEPTQKPKKNHCEICNVHCTSQCDYDTHLSGRKHLEKLADQCSNVKTLGNDLPGNQQSKKIEHEQKQNQFRCEICNVHCTSQCDYDTHLSGKKHLKKLADQSVFQCKTFV
jgi:transcription elongation factor Elf1